jgi:hypothetical protein
MGESVLIAGGVTAALAQDCDWWAAPPLGVQTRSRDALSGFSSADLSTTRSPRTPDVGDHDDTHR